MDFLGAIDWIRPWLEPVLPAAQSILQAPDWRDGINQAAEAAGLCNHRGLPIRFVPQEHLPAGTAYEAFIDATGMVPTRANAHDFFNALVWLTFPQIKRRLNALQAAEIARCEGRSTVRGKLRDAATIFDENAALIVTSDNDWARSLRERRWREALLDGRSRFGSTVEVVLFGHALMEKLIRPYKAITAHAWIVPVQSAFFSMRRADQWTWLDAAVARQIDERLNNGDFTPLPIIGVPGWTELQDEDFYADTTVFRVARGGPAASA